MVGAHETILSLDARAVKAAADEGELHKLIEEFAPFLHGCASKYAAASDKNKHDEFFSIAMLAFSEAIKKFDCSKGSFYSFALHVIRRRLIDEMRKYYRQDNTLLSLDGGGEGDGPLQADLLAAASQRQYAAQQEHFDLTLEIEQFKEELAQWGITMAALAHNSPKHARLRALCLRAVRLAANDQSIMQIFHIKRYVPIKKISEISQLPQKQLERMRMFIIASLIIRSGDYEKLSSYVDGKDGEFQ